MGQNEVLAFVIAPAGVDVAKWGWPRPLADADVASLVETLQTAINQSDDLTGHERCEIVGYLEKAKTAPATGPRPVLPDHSFSPWHARLLEQGQRLTKEFSPRLTALASKLESYRSRLVEADCDRLVASLGCHAELGMRLRLDPRPHGRSGLVARLASESRRGSLRRSIDCASQLADATSAALGGYDPFGLYYRPLRTIQQLVALHDEVQPTARSQRAVPRWRTHCWSEDIDGSLTAKFPVKGHVSVEALPDATELWLADCDAGRWPGVDSLVKAVLMHLLFLEIRPFQSENGRLARVMLSVDLRTANWPVLPLEAAIECNYHSYIRALRDALQSDDAECFIDVMLKVCDDGIAIGDRMIEAVGQERGRLVHALRDPDCLGPDANPTTILDVAEELLRSIMIEGVPGEQSSRALLSDLEEAGVLERISTPVGAVFGVPRIRQLLAELA
jgi:hypothetical protein